MVICFVLMGIGAALCIFYGYERIVKKSNLSIALKGVVSFVFVILGIYSHFMSSKAGFGILIVLGLISGLLGDVFLALRRHIKDKSDLFLTCGFASFGIGHVFYLSAIILKYFSSSKILYFILPFVLACLLAVAFALLGGKLGLEYGQFKTAIAVYGTLLMTAMFLCISMCIMTNFTETHLIIMMIGLVLFAASDMVLSKKYFGGQPDSGPLTVTNIATYFSGQFLIAFSLYFI